MAINYSWDVNTVDVYPELDGNANVIYTIHWQLFGEDTENQDSKGRNLVEGQIGTVSLNTSNIESFIALEDLTKETLVNWVETTMGPEQLQVYKDSIEAAIEKKITPTTEQKTLNF